MVIELDEDSWDGYCRALGNYGVATWGYITDEALKDGQAVIQMAVESLIQDGEEGREGTENEVPVLDEPRVAATT